MVVDVQPVRFGILGAARIAARALVAPAGQLEQVRVVGVAARDRARAEAFARSHRIPRVFRDYDALLGCDEITAVYIPLCNDLHAQWTIAAARRGKHVLVEKPICIDEGELDAVAEAAASNSVHVLEAVMCQHHPWQRGVRQLIDSQAYGRLESIRTEFTFPFSDTRNYRFLPRRGSGVFHDVGPYWVQFVQHCAGLAVETVEGFSDFSGVNGVDTTFEAKMKLSGGVEAEFLGSFERPFCATHWLRFEAARARVRNFLQPRRGPYAVRLDVHDTHSGERSSSVCGPEDHYLRQLEFFSRVLTGEVENLPFALSRERTKIIEAVFDSARRR